MKYKIPLTIMLIIFCSICSAQTFDELFSFNIQNNPQKEQVVLFVDIVVDDMMRWDTSNDGKLSRAELVKYFRFHKGLDVR